MTKIDKGKDYWSKNEIFRKIINFFRFFGDYFDPLNRFYNSKTKISSAFQWYIY